MSVYKNSEEQWLFLKCRLSENFAWGIEQIERMVSILGLEFIPFFIRIKNLINTSNHLITNK